MSVESGSTRNTLGSQLSTTSTSSSSSSKGTPSRKKEYWQKDRKIIRVLTVFAYMVSVSMAAVLLSAYYMFIWTSDVELSPVNKLKKITEAVRIQNNLNSDSSVDVTTVAQSAMYTAPEEGSGVLDMIQQIPLRTTEATVSINQGMGLGEEDTGEDDDEYQPRLQIVRRTGQLNQDNQREFFLHKPNNNNEPPFSIYDRNQDSSAENSHQPLALPLVQQIQLATSGVVLHNFSQNFSNINNRSISDNKSQSSSSSFTVPANEDISYSDDDDEADSAPFGGEPLLINANTLPYRQRQIPTPTSSPLLITKMISSSVLQPTTVIGVKAASSTSHSSMNSDNDPEVGGSASRTVETTTQPMISLLWNASKLVETNNSNNRNRDRDQKQTKENNEMTKSSAGTTTRTEYPSSSPTMTSVSASTSTLSTELLQA